MNDAKAIRGEDTTPGSLYYTQADYLRLEAQLIGKQAQLQDVLEPRNLAASDPIALAKQVKELRELLTQKVISESALTRFVVANGGINIGLEGGACALMAHAFGKQLYESEAINYIEASFDSALYPDLGQITVTLKRETGKTPHQLRLEAEAARDKLLSDLVSALGALAAQYSQRAAGQLNSGAPEHKPSIALVELLAGYLPDDREEHLEAIQAYADTRAAAALESVKSRL